MLEVWNSMRAFASAPGRRLSAGLVAMCGASLGRLERWTRPVAATAAAARGRLKEEGSICSASRAVASSLAFVALEVVASL